MAIFGFRDDKIELFIDGQSSIDEDGNLVTAYGCWSESEECHAQPAGAGVERKFPDGKVSSYSYTVHLNNDCKEYQIGDRVRIVFHDGNEGEFNVLGFHRCYLKSLLWV